MSNFKEIHILNKKLDSVESLGIPFESLFSGVDNYVLIIYEYHLSPSNV